MNRLDSVKRAAVVRGLCEGNSIRAVGRMVGCSKGAILRLLAEVGEFCAVYQTHVLVKLPCTRVEADEIWGYVGAKEAHRTHDGQGDIWTYVAICADSKLVITWLVGGRNAHTTHTFMHDLAPRLSRRIQLSTDNLGFYRSAVEDAFGWNGCDYGTITKVFGNEEGLRGRGKYSKPSVVIGVTKTAIMGTPAMESVSTSYVERQNLSIRLGMRRMTRATNGFSKKAENHALAFAVHMMHYNFCRPHQTLTKERNGIRTTPAMAAGVTDHVWTVEEILEKMDPNRLLH